jgi:glycosyltransferase involved in cell wall biosynthesis
LNKISNDSRHLPFSVLLSIYKKERPEHLLQCFESIYAQTLLPTEVVLVKDGALTPELDTLIDNLQRQHNNLKIVGYDTNQGLGYALNFGMRHCTYDIVARMDTDDVCTPNRFEDQVGYLATHPDIAVVSAWIDEFVGTPYNVTSTRYVPEYNEAICRFAKRRNPVNHPATTFKKQAVLAVGGYQPFYLFEDYYLWVRLILHGYRFYNIQKPLLYFRQTEAMFGRRGGLKYTLSEIKFQHRLYNMGFISLADVFYNTTVRTVVRLVPNAVRHRVYTHLLRKASQD